MTDQQEVKRSIEERESRAFARARKRRAVCQTRSALDIGGRQRAQRPRHLWEGQIGQVLGFEIPQPLVEAEVRRSNGTAGRAQVMTVAFMRPQR